MTARHHPSEQSILAHANGSLGTALAMVVDVHVEGCAQCRRDLALAERLGGLFLDAEKPVELSPGAFANVLERLALPSARHADSAPRFSLQHSGGSRRWLAPGIWIRPIVKDRAEGARAYLLGAAPGKSLPRHGHKGVEMTQVLEGEFFDGETRYGPGDFLEADDADEHALRAGPGKTCICMIASQGLPRGLPGLLMRLMA